MSSSLSPFSSIYPPFPLNFSGRCFNTYKSSISHKPFFYHFLFKSFLSAAHFHKMGRGHNSCETFAPPFGSVPISHQLLGKARAQAKYHHSRLISLGNQTTNIQLLFLCRTNPKQQYQSSRPQSITVQTFPQVWF